MKGAIAKAEEMQAQTPNSIIIGQFVNPANPAIHRKTTAVEIWDDTDGKVDIFVAGVGTGGTITGCGEVLKEQQPSVQVDRRRADRLAGHHAEAAPGRSSSPGPHKIQGIGAGFIPEVLNLRHRRGHAGHERRGLGDGAPALPRGRPHGRDLQRRRWRTRPTGSAARTENAGKMIVAVLASHGERYLSTALFDFPEEAPANSTI